MVNTSKILTVSYGTFSCTLEGFDDSFETMKAIAEYFRDLAADDRYFGAEPPTPDAEMLARIAEREIARRVEAHEDQGKIVLRAGDAPALAAAAMTVAAEDQSEDRSAEAQKSEAGDPVAEAQPEDISETAEESVAEVSEPIAEEVPADASAGMQAEPDHSEAVIDDVAEADEAAAEDEPAEDTTDTPVIADPAADLAAEVTAEPVSEEPVTAAEEDAAEEVVAETIEPSAEALVEDTPAEEVVAEEALADADEPQPEMAAPEAPADVVNVDAETPAEEPADIETPVAEMDEPEAPVDEIAAEAAIADTDADEGVAAAEEHVETAEDFFKNSPDPEAMDYYEAEAVDAPLVEPASIAAKLSRIRSVVSQSDQPFEQDDDYSEDEHAQDFLSDTAAELDAALARDDAAELQAAEAQDAGDAGATDEVDDADGDDGFEDTLSQLLADSMSGDETAENPAEEMAADEPAEAAEDAVAEAVSAEGDADASDDDAARVSEVEQAESDAVAADEISSEFDSAEPLRARDEVDAPTGDDMPEADALLSPEQEEELQRELAEVEADLVQDDAAQPVDMAGDKKDAENTAAQEPSVVVRDGRNKLERGDGQTDIERIFEEADSQLEKPESNRRRNAIQHLRAAVAATRAEKKAGADLQKNVDDTPYRSDLASVVRPRRPSASEGNRSERPVESRPAPLKLVAEQRVDMEREPIRPRRVSASELARMQEQNAAETDSSFSEYARQMGATRLPDLLEAAAAYMSDVEGRAQFSRPMLMHKIQEVERENFSREDGLRSFGQLLREGKIQKIKGGRFTVTEETEFRGDQRHAG